MQFSQDLFFCSITDSVGKAAEPPRVLGVVKKLIKAGKVQGTEIIQIIAANVPVLRTFCVSCIINTTNINGALYLKMLHYNTHTKRYRPFFYEIFL